MIFFNNFTQIHTNLHSNPMVYDTGIPSDKLNIENNHSINNTDQQLDHPVFTGSGAHLTPTKGVQDTISLGCT
jgi:hypothetical protein